MLYIITSREHLLEWRMHTSICFSVYRQLKKFLIGKIVIPV